MRRQPGLLVVHLLTAAIVYGIPLLGGLLLIVVESAGLDVPFVFRLLSGLLIAASLIIGIHQGSS